MKKLLIKVILDNNNNTIGAAVSKLGFKDDVEGTLITIGLLEDLKSVELDKIKTKNKAKITYK